MKKIFVITGILIAFNAYFIVQNHNLKQTVNARIDTLKWQVINLQNRVSSGEEELETNKSAIEDLEDRISDLE